MQNQIDQLISQLTEKISKLEKEIQQKDDINLVSFGPKEDVWRVIKRTTIIECPRIASRLNLKSLLIATETFQHTGSFKFRAAFNLASRVPNHKILTASSGNFGQVDEQNFSFPEIPK